MYFFMKYVYSMILLTDVDFVTKNVYFGEVVSLRVVGSGAHALKNCDRFRYV